MMSEPLESSTDSHRSLSQETDGAICEDFLRRLRRKDQPDIDELLSNFSEPRRSNLEVKLRLCRETHREQQNSPTDETTEWTADSAAADVLGDYEAIECLGRYRIQRPLGRGAYGQVFLALDEQLDRFVAIKTPRPNRVGGVHDIEKFQNEARILAKLDHPAIVPVYDVGITETHRCYVVSKFIDGEDLATHIRKKHPSITQAAQWVAGIAEALHHAHTQRLVHRDVKPGNILLDQDGNPYLVDFGLALREEDFGRGSPYAGTVYYMSPEQARGEGHRVDGRSDVFSLGVVFYLLLTSQRPFAGADKEQVLEKITKHEVRSPRLVSDGIPKELERICLRALAKRASDRYATAQDMADDLRHFLADYEDVPDRAAGGTSPSDMDSMTNIPAIMPKGLRSFDCQDAEFFLGLLPGPYDRQGLPQIVRFWKQQIEDLEADRAFRVGLIYGPSGCGKSSLIKAGILPNLTPNVRPILLEATPEETEAALLAAIRKRCPDVSETADLTDVLADIRRGGGLPEGDKLLIVIDQCEQWLHTHQAYAESALCQALRQCDGQRVQCILLVRDDFWMSATRLMRELEIRIVEGENSTVVDLFDKRHARKVLSAFGRAYEALPARRSATTAEQKRFLTLAIEELANEGKVISVQLVLFAEMVRHKPWTPETLRLVGGVQGTGVAFLEDAFESATAAPEHRLHQAQARAVLASLLPELGTDIKGHTQSHDQLFRISGCDSREDFEDLMRILNTELRLLTPAESQQSGSPADRQTPEEKRYQLAHDYLVPALRLWLTKKQRETRAGRVELLMTDRAEFWSAKPERKQLPSMLEWLSILRYVRRRDATETQRKMMAAATRLHLTHAALVALLVFAALWAGFQLYCYEHSANLVARLMVVEPEGIPDVVREMEPYRDWVDRLLRNADAGGDPQRELALLLAKRPLESEEIQRLLEYMLVGTPAEVRVIRDTLASEWTDTQSLADQLWDIVEDARRTRHERFRAACGLAEFDRTSERWKSSCMEVATWLVGENPIVVEDWGQLLSPARGQLVDSLKILFHQDEEVIRLNAATVLAEYLKHDVTQLVQLNARADTAQRRVLAEALREHQDFQIAVDLLQDELARTVEDDATDNQRAAFAQETANAATMLVLLGEPDEAWPLLETGPDPQVRTCLLHGIAQARIEPELLIRQLLKEENSSRKIGLLLSLAEYEMTSLRPRHDTRLVPILLDLFENHPHAGVHSASELLLRRLGHSGEIAEINLRLQTKDPVPGRDWYVSKLAGTLSVFRDPPPFQMGTQRGDMGWHQAEDAQQVTLGRSFAMATKEVTMQQFRVMWPDYMEDTLGEFDENRPFGGAPVDTMMGFCLWMSEAEGFSADECCYERIAVDKHRLVPDFLQRPGYRLPTEAEWEYACRAGTKTLRYDGYGTKFVASFARYRGVDDEVRTIAVGTLLPNDWGMFDMYGNVSERCQNVCNTPADDQFFPIGPYTPLTIRGGSFSSDAVDLRSACRKGVGPDLGPLGYGLRVARTILD